MNKKDQGNYTNLQNIDVDVHDVIDETVDFDMIKMDVTERKREAMRLFRIKLEKIELQLRQRLDEVMEDVQINQTKKHLEEEEC